MEYLDDEMDELFRKAGEHYPLKTSDSDWDAVLGRLQPSPGHQAPANGGAPEKRNNNRRFLWLLFLLPLGLFSIKYFSGGNSSNSISIPEQIKTPALHSASDEKADTGTRIAKNEKAASTLPGSAFPVNAENKASGKNGWPGREGDGKLSPEHSPYANGLTNTSGEIINTMPENHSSSGDRSNERQIISNLPGSKANNPVAQPNAAGQKEKSPEAKNNISTAKSLVTGQDNNATTNAGPANPPDKTPKKALAKKEKGIYFSLLAGPDLSTVKFQSVKKTGYSIGLLAGYRFSRRISVETGLFWDKKEYYSEGEYFNTSKTGIPATVKIKDLEGNCNMFEIPVSFRYNFAFSRKGRFFSTAGLSSYIMKKENYDYTTEDYPGWSRKVSYHNSSNNLFSILQLSAGYEFRIGETGWIRAEPYLNIPLKGVGIGSMPISSAGLHLGLTVPFR